MNRSMDVPWEEIQDEEVIAYRKYCIEYLSHTTHATHHPGEDKNWEASV